MISDNTVKYTDYYIRAHFPSLPGKQLPEDEAERTILRFRAYPTVPDRLDTWVISVSISRQCNTHDGCRKTPTH